jgi:hypothetical protein
MVYCAALACRILLRHQQLSRVLGMKPQRGATRNVNDDGVFTRHRCHAHIAVLCGASRREKNGFLESSNRGS